LEKTSVNKVHHNDRRTLPEKKKKKKMALIAENPTRTAVTATIATIQDGDVNGNRVMLLAARVRGGGSRSRSSSSRV